MCVDSDETGESVTNVLKRSVLNYMLGVFPLYGFIDALFIYREDHRCIHDLIAGTRVVYASPYGLEHRPGTIILGLRV
ncbi:MAG: hypothetical protein VX733_05800 [Candidatus Latescibacterota bacterium]|nr:hypothetical protein [Candidatus Latescibacterota bacterium]